MADSVMSGAPWLEMIETLETKARHAHAPRRRKARAKAAPPPIAPKRPRKQSMMFGIERKAPKPKARGTP